MYVHGQNLVHVSAYFALDDGCELQEGLAYGRDFLYPRSVNAAADLHRENVTLGEVALQDANVVSEPCALYNDIPRLIILLEVPGGAWLLTTSHQMQDDKSCL